MTPMTTTTNLNHLKTAIRENLIPIDLQRFSTGEPVQPQGQPGHPFGQPAQPGQPLQPQGQPGQPAGQPQGQPPAQPAAPAAPPEYKMDLANPDSVWNNPDPAWAIHKQRMLDQALLADRQAQADELRRQTLGTLTQRDLKVKDLKEAQELIELGRKAKAGDAPAGQPGEIPEAVKAQLEQAQAEREAQAKQIETYKRTTLQEKIRSLYRSNGGLPNNGTATPEDAAISQFLAEGSVAIDDQFQVVSKVPTISVEQLIQQFLKVQTHFRAPEERGGPPRPNTAGLPQQGTQAPQADMLDQFINRHFGE